MDLLDGPNQDIAICQWIMYSVGSRLQYQKSLLWNQVRLKKE
jgi:hypothetical protein